VEFQESHEDESKEPNKCQETHKQNMLLREKLLTNTNHLTQSLKFNF